MATQEFLVIKRGYDFSKWLLQHTGKFPKSYRFSVAAKKKFVAKIKDRAYFWTLHSTINRRFHP